MRETLLQWTGSPLFGIALCLTCYSLGLWCFRRLRTPLANPLLIAIALAVAALGALRIPLENFKTGGDWIAVLLGPATAVLALNIYNRRQALARYFWPVLAGCLAGCLASMASAALLCRAFGLTDTLTFSMVPKSVTTPIAMEVSRSLGGVPAVTVAAVLLTGVLGAVFSPSLVKLLRLTEPVAAGVAIGAASHAIGTAKALEMGELVGAMSSVSLAVSGLMTAALALLVG